MASSNRHWPSMFKSKPCNPHHHHQWQHDINPSLIPTGCHKTPCTSGPGCEERSPEPKPRWNPRPEQIRILEAIFNSGMVNPPRDEIRKIRAKLQEYGQVGDANVFYWFQNRKSRSKHKQRHLQNPTKSSSLSQQNPPHHTITSAKGIIAPSSSSSSSDKSSPNSGEKAPTFSIGSTNLMEVSNSPTGSVNQSSSFFQTQNEFLAEPFFFQMQQTPTSGANNTSFTQGFCFPDILSSVNSSQAAAAVGGSSGVLLTDLLGMNPPLHGSSKKVEDEKLNNLQQQLNYAHVMTSTAAPSVITHQPTIPTASPLASCTVNHIQGLGETGAVSPTKSTVFINDVALEVASGPFNVRETFGDDAVLIHSSGQPLLMNEWGVTLQPLQHGSFYYLVRTPASAALDTTIDLI